MSYILEALKKAESERRLGSIPNMHAQPLATAAVARSPFWRNPLMLSALAAVLLMAAIIAWWAPWQTSGYSGLARQSSSGSVDTGANRETTGEAPPAAVDFAVPPVAQATAVKESPAAAPEEAVVEPVKPTVEPKPKAEPRPVKKKIESTPAAAVPKVVERKTESAPPAAVVATAEPRLPALRELPENIQREIPAMAVGGYIYSSVPSERSVLINNRLLREGSEISHGLVLEKMLPKEAVLNYKGYRYRVPY